MQTTSLLDKTTLFLFSSFPREVAEKPNGNFQRKLIYSTNQFIDYIERNNGINTQVFTSVYSLDFTIDKIFIDIDGSLEYLKALCRYLSSEQISYIPVASGKKGYHLYMLLKPKQYENTKQLLYAVTMYILEQTFGKQDLTNLIQNDIIDSHLIGNTKGMCRIPNTLRSPENLNYCTYLPPSFFDFSQENIAFHIKKPHVYDYVINSSKLPTLDSFNVDVEKYTIYNNNNNHTNLKLTTSIKNIKDIKAYLKTVLRPCLYNHIIQPEPKHLVRVASTIDLLQFLSQKQVFEIYARLKWTDWNPEETSKQINYATKYFPYSCKRLRELQIPKICCE